MFDGTSAIDSWLARSWLIDSTSQLTLDQRGDPRRTLAADVVMDVRSAHRVRVLPDQLPQPAARSRRWAPQRINDVDGINRPPELGDEVCLWERVNLSRALDFTLRMMLRRRHADDRRGQCVPAPKNRAPND
jgi:hypothetical protein